jgi:nucleotide-binding universal stress UspA family protein
MSEPTTLRETAAAGVQPTGHRSIVLPVTPDAAGLISDIAPLLAGRQVLVVSAWQSVERASRAARAALPAWFVRAGAARMDEERRDAAQRSADAVAAVAREHGVEATARTVCGPLPQAVATLARDEDAQVVVVARPSRRHRLMGGAPGLVISRGR